jgi:hypothetical protein
MFFIRAENPVGARSAQGRGRLTDVVFLAGEVEVVLFNILRARI